MADYAGDAGVTATWEQLESDNSSLLVDVRTTAEWTFVGVPDLGALGKNVVLQEWQQFPQMNVNPHFADQVAEAVRQAGGDENTQVFFLCRSGVRSQSAAAALTALGFKRCFNVTGGFEGPLDDVQHRGNVNGWKAEGLPWRQG